MDFAKGSTGIAEQESDALAGAMSTATDPDPPAAALHFIDLDGQRGVGVFRVRSWPDGEFVTWPIQGLSTRIPAFISGPLFGNFVAASSQDQAFLQTGSELYNLMFPPAATAARRAFETYVSTQVPGAALIERRPKVVVRTTLHGTGKEFAVPLSLMAVRIGAERVFVGQHMRVVSPLRYQDYRPASGCIGRWVFAASLDADRTLDELRKARRQFAQSLACSGKDCFTDLPKFGDWIGDYEASERNPLALLMLGHYSNQSFSFTQVGGITALSVGRRFRSPSVAIVNACGTAAPGADSFITELHQAGFQAIVGTALTVDHEMAGQYTTLARRC